MKPDELSPPCRDFYENAVFKLTLSLMLAAFGMMFLGFCSAAGGLSASNEHLTQANFVQDDYQNLSNESQAAGWGFGCFTFLLGFFIMIVAALWVSPFVGSANERKTLSSPQEFEHLGRVASPQGSFSSPPPLQPNPAYSTNPILSSTPPPPGTVSQAAVATYTVGATPVYASSPPVHGTPVYSSTGYLNKEQYEAPTAPPMK